MTGGAPAASPETPAVILLRRLLQATLSVVLWGAVFFAAAGTVGVPRAWIYLATALALLAINVVAARQTPSAARGEQGLPTQDERLLAAVLAVVMLLVPVVAGLDVRLGGWMLPGWTLLPGLVVFVLGNVPIAWAMHVVGEDPDASGRGPYRFVRHPMSLGIIVQYVGRPAMLGAGWAWVPAVAVMATVLARTRAEDRRLQQHLRGYAEYAASTRARLIPGVW